MIRKNWTFFFLLFSLIACGESSNADNASSSEADIGVFPQKESAVEGTNLPECDMSSQSYVDESSLLSWKDTPDTVCFYEDFSVKDTICCFQSQGTYLLRRENGEYVSVSTDYAVGFRYDTLFATVDPSTIHRCMAYVGNEHCRAVKIGSQTWLSENVKGEGCCLNDNIENCKLFGELMSYSEAKEACSGNYRLPTKKDVDILMQAVGAAKETSFTRDVCGEIPGEVRYFDMHLFTNFQDFPEKEDVFEFVFWMNGGMHANEFEDKFASTTERICFFLQSDENVDFRNAFCYNVVERYAAVVKQSKNEELYARCIMK